MKDLFKTIQKYRGILDHKQKLKIGFILFLMMLNGLFEMLSISMIVPILTVLMNDSVFDSNSMVLFVRAIVHIDDVNQFIALVLVVMIVIYVIKGVIYVLLEYVQARFTTNNRIETQRKMMCVVLGYPYDYFLANSTSDVIKIVQDDVANCFSLLSQLMSFFSEIMVMISVFITICIINLGMALGVSVIVILEVAFIFKVMKKRMLRQGIVIRELGAISNKWLLQSVAGIKETKVAHKEDFFVKQYVKYSKGVAVQYQNNKGLSAVPKSVLESVTVSVVLLYILISVLNGTDIGLMLPQLSAFALAAIKIIPSANRISTVMSSVSFLTKSLDSVFDTMKVVQDYDKESNRKKREQISQGKKVIVSLENSGHIAFSGITYRYPNTEKIILDDVSFDIPIGKSVGIVGPSGAGKTTTVDIMLGLLKPEKGEVLCDGVNIMADYNGWLSRLSYIPQMIFMMDDTIAANVAYGFREDNIDEAKVWEVLEEASLKEFVEGLPDKLNTMIGERGVRLSGGQRQRIGIARALYTDPEIIILDEATSALDNETESAIMESINKLHGRKTLVIIAHRLTTIKECDMVYRVDGGRVELVEEGV